MKDPDSKVVLTCCYRNGLWILWQLNHIPIRFTGLIWGIKSSSNHHNYPLNHHNPWGIGSSCPGLGSTCQVQWGVRGQSPALWHRWRVTLLPAGWCLWGQVPAPPSVDTTAEWLGTRMNFGHLKLTSHMFTFNIVQLFYTFIIDHHWYNSS